MERKGGCQSRRAQESGSSASIYEDPLRVPLCLPEAGKEVPMVSVDP